jgi:GNAT superfamily N-acetyltransferase
MTVETQMSVGQLRLMRITDVSDACELSAAAGWNQTSEDWKMLLAVAPEGCFGIEADGRLVSTTTLVAYEQRLAWIGMVLTLPSHRGRGHARRLLEYALNRAATLGIETLKLDATEQGKPLYESTGFIAEQPIERWSRPGMASLLETSGSRTGRSFPWLDHDAFGADRSMLLQHLAARSTVLEKPDGFLFTRAGRITSYLGPCVASDASVARALIAEFTGAHPDVSWSWDLLPGNRDAALLASEFGFTRQRSLTRMARGKPLRGEDKRVFAIAGFELG